MNGEYKMDGKKVEINYLGTDQVGRINGDDWHVKLNLYDKDCNRNLIVLVNLDKLFKLFCLIHDDFCCVNNFEVERTESWKYIIKEKRK